MDGASFGKTYPIVLRFAGLSPDNLRRLEMHAKRDGGDVGHCDPAKREAQKNAKPLIGDEDWISKTLGKIHEMRMCNFADELDALEKRNRRKDLQRRVIEGPHDPWRPTRHGPLREVILTVNKEWFAADPVQFFDHDFKTANREALFQRRALDWLRKEFGEDVVYARADRDEAAYHIHAVIMPQVEVEITRRDLKTGQVRVIAKRQMLQPSKHAIIEDYEKAQDSVGEWFAPLGLVRGERHKEAFRKAIKAGKEPPKKRVHVRTAEWRRKEEIRLDTKAKDLDRKEAELELKKCLVIEREGEAESIISYADRVARGEVDPEADADKPSQQAPSKSIASPAHDRARKVFVAALKRLRIGERSRAEKAAAARLAEGFDEIKKAQAAIMKIANVLPTQLRETIAASIRSLSGAIMRLERFDPSIERRLKPQTQVRQTGNDGK
ncbi:MAG: plasmid recombination protein [Rhodobacterales bacterium]|nr:plasmid recombination protein [Rhodobacterales bacterium]MDX5390008.1 plasmid recombination protein [Rhodobacterales bacterium]MDX5489699.1 plasmid recombination protein [Rhodobacterales bacterium]